MRTLAGSSHHSGIAVIAALLLLHAGYAFTEEAVKKSEAFIESARKDGIATIISTEKPTEERYAVSAREAEPVSVTILQTMQIRSKGVIRYRSIVRSEGTSSLKTGETIILREYREAPSSYIGEKNPTVPSPFRSVITTPRDGREMVLVPSGRFSFGSNEGDADESPRSLLRLENYYIDRFEVSNADYLVYVQSAHASMPRSWGGVFPEKERNLPVIVSYGEAVSFASWAGKRLPTEKEWEKAANGSRTTVLIQSRDGYTETIEKTIYPWGNIFSAARCNSREKDSQGDSSNASFLQVNAEPEKFSSAYGAAQMAGNAQEWTDSWYEPYEGNAGKNFRYGRKYKVIRGGAWYSSRDRVRITARETGGTPNLDEDVIAGFRCVKDPAEADQK
jgi:formylglycine-generating enzyme required for sulfatase activity